MLCNVLYTNVQHQEEKRYFDLIGSNTTSSFYLVYMIKLGTLENEVTADVEWRHHAYTHTAKKRRFLSIE